MTLPEIEKLQRVAVLALRNCKFGRSFIEFSEHSCDFFQIGHLMGGPRSATVAEVVWNGRNGVL